MSDFIPASSLSLIGLSVASAWPLGQAWRRSTGLPLRSAVVWSILANFLGGISQVESLFEPLKGGRPLAGHWSYLACLATLAAMISVFNARRPGGNAWAILMGLLFLIFLLPWLEGAGLARGRGRLDRLRLEMPWSLFFGLITLAGVTNYLATSYSISAGLVGFALILEATALVVPSLGLNRRAVVWSIVPGLFAMATWLAWWQMLARRMRPDSNWRLWYWFRDHWGAIWGLRVIDRFNRSAEAARRPYRLTWHGLKSLEGKEITQVSTEAEELLSAMLSRFACPEKIRSIARG